GARPPFGPCSRRTWYLAYARRIATRRRVEHRARLPAHRPPEQRLEPLVVRLEIFPQPCRRGFGQRRVLAGIARLEAHRLGARQLEEVERDIERLQRFTCQVLEPQHEEPATRKDREPAIELLRVAPAREVTKVLVLAAARERSVAEPLLRVAEPLGLGRDGILERQRLAALVALVPVV